ncbi:MAG: hypothetical protein EOM80_11405 [Erysipelotrichia bacterium]|nr:hypothetical protein [Erysipelotrichia bacterium]
MIEICCESCHASFTLPEGYAAPYIKCPGCGALQKISSESAEPEYKILDSSTRQKIQQSGPVSIETNDEAAEPSASGGLHVAQPAFASASRKAAVAQNLAPRKIVGTFANDKKSLEDVLGKGSLETVLRLVAGYLDELDENKRRAAKARVMQTLMRSRFPAELAARAVEYAEKSDETLEILWKNYQSSLIMGVIIFFAGVIISVGVHFVAHPGRGFLLFQVPCAVGFAYAANAGINMAGLRVPALRSKLVHYGFLTLATLLILAYIAWGIIY